MLGRVYDDRSGVGIVGKAIAEGIAPEKDRQRDCANMAKFHGADALVVTSDQKVIKALGLSQKEVNDTAPLFNRKDSVVLAVKFQ